MLVCSSTADLVLHDPLKQLNLRFLSPLNIFHFVPRCHLANLRSAGMFFLASRSFLRSPHTMICVCYSYKGTLTSINDSFQFLIILNCVSLEPGSRWWPQNWIIHRLNIESLRQRCNSFDLYANQQILNLLRSFLWKAWFTLADVFLWKAHVKY